MADCWHLTEHGALLYGDGTGGITVVGLAAWKDCPERTEAIRALAQWCNEAISSAAALAAEATEPPERYEKFGDYDPERDVSAELICDEVEHDDLCEQEFINPPGAYGPCGCAHRRAEEAAEEARLQTEAYEEWRSQQWPIW